MPCSPRWSALTLVTTLTSLAVTPMPLRSIPPRAVSRIADLEAGGLEHPARAGRAGEVALLHRLAHDDDTVGRAPGRREAGGHAHVAP